MSADRLPVLAGVLRDQRRSLVLWSLAVAAVATVYVSFYSSMGSAAELEPFIENLPEGLVQALGYDRIATPAGYLRSTVYGLLGPVLLLVFAISTGSRLIAGEEETGTLELELASPVGRRRIFGERLLSLWLSVLVLVVVVAGVTLVLVRAMDMEVATRGILAVSTGLLLLVIGFGTVAFAVGAATGRRALAVGTAAGLAVAAFVADAVGPLAGADRLASASPFHWYLGGEPLVEGFDVAGLLLLAIVPLVAGVVGLVRFRRRDLMV